MLVIIESPLGPRQNRQCQFGHRTFSPPPPLGVKVYATEVRIITDNQESREAEESGYWFGAKYNEDVVRQCIVRSTIQGGL